MVAYCICTDLMDALGVTVSIPVLLVALPHLNLLATDADDWQYRHMSWDGLVASRSVVLRLILP